MKITEVLEILKKEDPIIVDGGTFEPREFYHVTLRVGDDLYWIKNDNNIWLSLDITSEEVALLQDIDEELEAGDETLSYQGDDYELTYGESGKILDEEDNEIDSIKFREFEHSGDIIRIVEFEITGDVIYLTGKMITEDELQEV